MTSCLRLSHALFLTESSPALYVGLCTYALAQADTFQRPHGSRHLCEGVVCCVCLHAHPPRSVVLPISLPGVVCQHSTFAPSPAILRHIVVTNLDLSASSTTHRHDIPLGHCIP